MCCPGCSGEGRLFPFSYRELRRRMERALILAGLPAKTNPHLLRHSVASAMLREGVPATTVQRVMGHASLSTTVSTYLHDIAGSERGALVLEVLGGTPAEKAGIKAGDIIVSVGREAVSDADDLVSALRDEDGAVSIGVVRRGVKRTIETTLEDAPRVMRFKSGDGQLGMGRLREMERPRVRVERDTDRDGLREELEKLRSELRDLKRELEDSKR